MKGGCRSHCNGCMNVAWAMFWGGSRGTKPCVFPCKVAAAGDERYLVCAAVAAAVGLPFFLPHCNGGFKLLWVCLCVRSYRVFWNLCLQIALEWLHDVARTLFWGGSRSTKPCVFPCKVAAAGDERYLVCAAVAAAVGLLFFLPHCNGGFKLLWVCLCVRSYRVFWNLCLQIALEWLHDVARALFWGGSRSTKPCVFPCKVAAAGDERYLVCAAVAAAVGLPFFLCRIVMVASSCFGCACVCVVIGCFGICACRSHCNGCMMLQGICFGEEAGARNLVFFRVKWLQPAMKGTSSVRRLRLRTVCFFFLPHCNGGFKLLWVCLCVRSYRVFWNLCLQIALEWLHDVARALFSGGSRSTKPCVFPCKVAAAGDDMKGTSSVRRVRLRSVCLFFWPHCNGGFKLLWVCLCVRSYRVFWNLCLQIALEWLRQGCLPPHA